MTHMMRQKAHELQILWDSQGRRLWCQQRVCVDSQHSSAAPWEDAWCFPWVIAASSSHLRHDAPRTWPLEETELKPSLRILFQSWNNQVVYIIFILHGLRYLFYAGLSHKALYYCYSCLLRRYLLYISGIFVFLNAHNTMRFSIFLYRCSDATLQWRCNRFALHTSYMYDDQNIRDLQLSAALERTVCRPTSCSHHTYWLCKTYWVIVAMSEDYTAHRECQKQTLSDVTHQVTV